MEYTPDELNYFRLCYITFKLIPEGLREIFKQEWDFRYRTSLGEWKNTPMNGLELYRLENARGRSRYVSKFEIMQNGNTAEWDISCLLVVMLYSDSIGATLSPALKLSIDELRQVRNETVHFSEPSLTDVKFQNYADRVMHAFKSLGLSISDVEAVVKSQRSFREPELKIGRKAS